VLPEWRSELVAGLALAAYEEQAFDRLPILGDALEEAGCDATELLAHCRDSRAHVRGAGCWTSSFQKTGETDALLGKR
jgi:hypothetical protein